MSSLLKLLKLLDLSSEHPMNRDGLFVLHGKIRQFLVENPTSFLKVWNLLNKWLDEYRKDNIGLPDGFGLSPPHILLGCLLMDEDSAGTFIYLKGKNTHNTVLLMAREPPLNPDVRFVEKLPRHKGGTESFPRFDPSWFPFQNPLGALRKAFENPLGSLNEITQNPLGSLNEILQNPLGALNEIPEGLERPVQGPKRPQPVRRKRRCGEVSGQGTPEVPDRKSSKLIGVRELGVGFPFGRKP